MKAYKYRGAQDERFNKALAYIVKMTCGSVKILLDFDLDVELEVVKILKRRQFVENIDGWTNGFVKVILAKDGVFICHNKITKQAVLTRVENPLLTLNQWIDYFSGI